MEARSQIAQDAARGRLVWSQNRSAQISSSRGDGDCDGRAGSERGGLAVDETSSDCPEESPQTASGCPEKSLQTVSNCPEESPQTIADCPEESLHTVSDCPEKSLHTATDCPEPYQLMVIHQDLKPTVLKSETQKALSSHVINVEELDELPQL